MIGNSPHICMFALRDIAIGEEICYNYGPANFAWRQVKDFIVCEKKLHKLLFLHFCTISAQIVKPCLFCKSLTSTAATTIMTTLS